MTLVFWAATLYLSTAYTTLLTPTNIIAQDTMRGTELDFSSDEFWDWVITFSNKFLLLEHEPTPEKLTAP